MIDLHMHTTASDGRCTPEDLIRRAHAVGIRTLSVTDHDTMAGIPGAAAAAAALGLTIVPGIELTTVHDGRDVHVLGYFLDASSAALQRFLEVMVAERLDRARDIADRLAAAGAPIDFETVVAGGGHGRSPKSLGRPQLAQALVRAGHVASVSEGFERFLGEGCPAYLPHRGFPPAEAVRVIHAAGGLASLAHPGTVGRDELIAELAEAGIEAVEVYHSAHDADARAKYRALAERHDLAVTGGSDYHGEGVRRAEFFGVVELPAAEFERFRELSIRRRGR
jgi:predicted metal-dependent phosphoesterase TrpH